MLNITVPLESIVWPIACPCCPLEIHQLERFTIGRAGQAVRAARGHKASKVTEMPFAH